MKSAGIVRKVDRLGRVVLPKEMRRIMSLSAGQEMEIYIDGENIILCKYHKRCVLCGGENGLAVFVGKPVCDKCVEHFRQ